MRLFRKDFFRDIDDSVQTPHISKRNSNIHFILGNAGHAWGRLTVKSSLTFYFSEADITCKLRREYRVYDRNSRYIRYETFSSHTASNDSSQRRLEMIHKRFSDTAAVLDPQVGLTHSADVICTIFFLRATSFYSFHSVPFDCQCHLVFIWTFIRTSSFPAKSKHFDWLPFDSQSGRGF